MQKKTQETIKQSKRKRAMWKVGGIKIESAAGRQKKTRAAMEFREKWKFFSLRPPGRKRKEISVWVLWVK